VHGGEWALATIEVCLAVLRSARTGKDVKLKNQIALDDRPATRAN
jgi:phthalate 4,5-cis-dihydrodiol dehydrogenase